MDTQAQIIATTRHEFDGDFKALYILVEDSRGNERTLRIRPTRFGIAVETTSPGAPLTLTPASQSILIIEP